MSFVETIDQGVLLLDRTTLRKCLDFPAVIDAVAEGYAEYYRDNAIVPPIAHLTIPKPPGEIDVKTAYLSQLGTVAVKVGAGFFENEALGLPTGSGTIVLLDAATGFPLSIMDGDLITVMRTGAAGATAAKHLARPDSRTAFILGAGAQGSVQLSGLMHVLLGLTDIWVFDRQADKAERFRASTDGMKGLRVRVAGSIEEGASNADVIVTATPSRCAQVNRDWVRAGTHVNAIGADGPGKQELDPRILKDADKLVVDSWVQARDLGECQHGVSAGWLAENGDSIHAEIGALVAGVVPGRERDDELTVFDATGIAVQDVAVATLAYQTALSLAVGSRFRFGV